MQIRLEQGTDMGNWLLQPLRESNLQLFALVSLWISNKVGFHTFFSCEFSFSSYSNVCAIIYGCFVDTLFSCIVRQDIQILGRQMYQ